MKMKKMKVKHKGVLMNPAKRTAHAMTAHLQGTARQKRNAKNPKPRNPSMYDF